MQDSRRYKKILKAQKILQTAAEFLLKKEQSRKAELKEKNTALLAMLDKLHGAPIDISWGAEALARNYTELNLVEQGLVSRQKERFIAQKRVELCEAKYKSLRQAEEGKELNSELEEYLSKQSSSKL